MKEKNRKTKVTHGNDLNAKMSRKQLIGKTAPMPLCPHCYSNRRVIATRDQHVLFQLVIAKPLDTHFCNFCEKGFTA